MDSPTQNPENVSKVEKKLMQNKNKYEKVVNIGKFVYELILRVSDPRNIDFKEKLGMSKTQLKRNFNKDLQEHLAKGITLDNLKELDFSQLHNLVLHLCCLEEKDPVLQQKLKTFKDSRNIIAHSADDTEFTGLFIWQKIEELRTLFIEILGRVHHLYGVDINDKMIEISENVDKVLERTEVVVSELEATEFMNQLQAGVKCPSTVKVEIKEDPRHCLELDELLERIGKEDSRIKLSLNKAYYDVTELKDYNSQKHFLSLSEESSRCQLVWYRGNLNMEMIDMLPSTLEQLYIRVMPNQIESLNNQFNKFSKLWSLALYLDFSEPSNADPFHLDTVDPASLPVLKYKGKQLGLRICACITVSNFPWIIELIKRLTKEHQCDTLEFYRTRLNTGHEIEALLRALHDAEVHVTTWIKVENMEDRDENRREEEMRLSIVAKNLFLGDFKFLAPWK